MAKIVIDAGNGGRDSGAVYRGRMEKDDALALALEVGAMLENAGQDVVYTRTDDIYQTPSEKVRIANNSGADYFLSIHRNSNVTPNRYSGVQSLIYNNGGIKEEMGENINENLEDLGFLNLGVDLRPNLTVLRRTRMPAILVEAGFINNDQDNQLFDERFEEIARGIADGVLEAIEDSSGSSVRTSGQTSSRETPAYRVQVGLFAQYDNAAAQYDRLLQYNRPATIISLGGLYAVLSGTFDTLAEARQYADNLQGLGFDTAIIQL